MQAYIDAFIRRVDAEALPVQAFKAYQDDSPVAEHHWAEDVPRNIYSHTKSYMSTAVGIAIGEGLLTLDDRPADFFPDAVPVDADPRVREITLRHLLMMSSGIGEALLMSGERSQGIGAPDYARFVLSHPLKHAPGEVFCYSNGDSYLAGRMVEHRAGQTLREYLNTRLFMPLDIALPEWEHDPLGHTFGASGMLLRIHDMMKLGRLFLAGGVWEGKTLVPPEWIAQATAKQIETQRDPNNPWSIGYGYQFWRSPYPDAYRADGMYGQITTVLPRARAVVAIQCAASERFDEIRAALDETLLSRI